jgi:hypothetical protein
MSGSLIPSSGRWLDNLTGRKVTTVNKKSSNAVTRVDPTEIEVIGPGGKRTTLRELQEYLRDHPDAMSGTDGNGPSFHKHGDTHIHVTVQAAPPVEPQLPEKSFGRQAAEFGASAATATAMLPVRLMLGMFKMMWESNQKQQQQAHELRLAELKLQQEQMQRNRFGDAIHYFVGHLMGFAIVMMMLALFFAVLFSVPRWSYGPWGWWGDYYPPPPPAHYRDRDYDRR